MEYQECFQGKVFRSHTAMYYIPVCLNMMTRDEKEFTVIRIARRQISEIPLLKLLEKM